MFDTTKYKGDDSNGKGREKCNNHFCVIVSMWCNPYARISQIGGWLASGKHTKSYSMENHHLQ